MSGSTTRTPQFILLLGLAAVGVLAGLSALRARSAGFALAVATPSLAGPTPVVPGLPARSQQALLHVAETAHLPIEQLALADEYTQTLPLTDHIFWRGMVLDREGRRPPLYEVIIDARSGEILDGREVETVWEAEQAAYRARYGEQVLEQVAQQVGVSVERLRITSDVLESYPLTGVIFWRVKLLDVEAGAPYHLALGPDGAEVDPAALRQAEFEAHQARYGRLNPELYYRLQATEPGEVVPVLIWVRGVDYEWVDAHLAQRYPELAAEYHFTGGHIVQDNGSLVHLEPELLRQVHADYNDLLDQAHLAAAQPVVGLLQARGHEAQPFELFPGVYAELPKSTVLELNEAPLESLGTIYWGAIEIQPTLDSTAQTIRASEVWDSGLCYDHGCTGTGITITVAEGGIVRSDIPHGALQGKIVAANVDEATDWHAAVVAGVIAGDHPDFPQYRGIAYGCNLLVSAKIGGGTLEDMIDGLEWAVSQQKSFAVNASFSTTSTRKMQPEDRIFDYLVRLWDPTIAVGAGNREPPDPWNVTSPGKAYNVITVGAFNDHDDPDWSNDDMWDDGIKGSCYVDPYIDGQNVPGDREKPEVVAVGKDVTTVSYDHPDPACQGVDFCSQDGTSVAAPQVTALAALLMERYDWLRFNPEAIKAIIMASAVNNVEGDERLSDKDGAGGIDVSYALSVFQNGGWCYHNIPDITFSG